MNKMKVITSFRNGKEVGGGSVFGIAFTLSGFDACR